MLKTLALLQNIQIHFNKQGGKNPATLLKIKQASRRLKRLACFGDDGDGSDDVYGIWVGVCKKDRHHRHHRHAYSEMTLAVYYCSKQK